MLKVIIELAFKYEAAVKSATIDVNMSGAYEGKKNKHYEDKNASKNYKNMDKE